MGGYKNSGDSNNGITLEGLKENQKELRECQKEIQKTQITILTVLKNGLQHSVKDNSKKIEELTKETRQLKEKNIYQDGFLGFLSSSKDLIGWLVALLLAIRELVKIL